VHTYLDNKKSSSLFCLINKNTQVSSCQY